jgi:hypothetical protein
MVGEGAAKPTSGWGPMIRAKSTHSSTTEFIHGHNADFVVIDYPTAFYDRIAIHRKDTRYDAAGVIFVEVPAGAGPQVAAFLHTFVHLPGAFPPKLHLSHKTLEGSSLPL